MKKGENIFKRKDGRWEARYIKGYELSGKIKYGFCYGKTYQEAKEKVAKFKAAIVSGKPLPSSNSRRRFAFYCDAWLQKRKTNIRESTYTKYDTILEKHIKPKLGGCYPLGITTGVVDGFTKELLDGDGLSVKTVHDILTVLHGILKYIAELFPGIAPTVEITYPKESRKEMRVLSRDEQKRLAVYLLDGTDFCKFGVLLMLFTGLRIGELCALRWSDVNIKEKVISVSATMQRLRSTDTDTAEKTKILIGAPKSDTSVRTIPLTDNAAELCRKFAVRNPCAYILTGTSEFMEPRSFQYRIEKYTRECGLDGIHAHTLRHTFATRAVEVGFEIKTLSEILGHANTTITLLLAHKLTVFVGVVFVNELIALENAILSPCKRSIALFVSGFGVALGYGHGKLFERVRKITACNLIPLDRCVLLFGNNITDCGIHFFNGIRLSAGDKDTLKGCHTVCIGYGILVNGNA